MIWSPRRIHKAGFVSDPMLEVSPRVGGLEFVGLQHCMYGLCCVQDANGCNSRFMSVWKVSIFYSFSLENIKYKYFVFNNQGRIFFLTFPSDR